MWVPDLLGYVYAYKHTSMIVLNNIGSDIDQVFWQQQAITWPN